MCKLLLFLCALSSLFADDSAFNATELAPTLVLFSTSSGNVIASIGPDGALLIGTPSIASTPQIEKAIEARTKSPLRYVVISEPRHGQLDADAGWAARGAFVAMQEKALERLGGHTMGHAPAPDPHLTQLGVDRPRVAFSEVITFDMNGDSIHLIHQPAAYSDADFLVHFHVGRTIYMGNVFPGHSYPDIDPKFGAALDGILQLTGHWTSDKMHLIPAQGPATTGADAKAFHDMLDTVRTRIQQVVTNGGTAQDALAAQPTKEFDVTYGQGPVKPEAFITAVYNSLKAPKK